jgi:uncharacterized protein (DUF1697 family)
MAVTYAAFLRGINVGGKAMISMAALKDYFEKLGFDNVATYINSGNVVFQTKKVSCRKLEIDISQALAGHFKKDIAVVVKTKAEMETLLEATRKRWPKPKDERRDVILLRHTIDKPSVLDDVDTRDGIDRVAYEPGAILWSADTAYVSKSKESKLVSNVIYRDITIRTVGTIEKVHLLMDRLS